SGARTNRLQVRREGASGPGPQDASCWMCRGSDILRRSDFTYIRRWTTSRARTKSRAEGRRMSVLDQFRLDGKRAFVTGGSRGFGRAIALAFAEAGADLVLTARGGDALEKVAAEVRARGRAVRTYPADLSDPAATE